MKEYSIISIEINPSKLSIISNKSDATMNFLYIGFLCGSNIQIKIKTPEMI